MSCCQTSVNPSKLSDWITSPVKTWPKWISEVARSHTLRLCGQKCNVSRCFEIFSLLCHHEERTSILSQTGVVVFLCLIVNLEPVIYSFLLDCSHLLIHPDKDILMKNSRIEVSHIVKVFVWRFVTFSRCVFVLEVK